MMKMYRKRYIPNEVVDISNDEVVHMNEELLITKWFPIRPRKDIKRGVSYTFLDKGYKVSEFIDYDENIICWYCDIIDVERNEEGYTFVDLLVDVKVQADGRYELVDLDELVQAYRENLIDVETLCRALGKLENLLRELKDEGLLKKIKNEYQKLNEI